jgi:hypothetical protein
VKASYIVNELGTMSQIHWRDATDTTAAIIDMALNIMVYKRFSWTRVWQFLLSHTDPAEIMAAKESIYEEYIQRGGEETESVDSA